MPETARLLGLSNPSAEGSRAGREVLRWLAQPHILNIARARFDTLLLEIAEYAEEWFTGAQAMRSPIAWRLTARNEGTRRQVPRAYARAVAAAVSDQDHKRGNQRTVE